MSIKFHWIDWNLWRHEIRPGSGYKDSREEGGWITHSRLVGNQAGESQMN